MYLLIVLTIPMEGGKGANGPQGPQGSRVYGDCSAVIDPDYFGPSPPPVEEVGTSDVQYPDLAGYTGAEYVEVTDHRMWPGEPDKPKPSFWSFGATAGALVATAGVTAAGVSRGVRLTTRLVTSVAVDVGFAGALCVGLITPEQPTPAGPTEAEADPTEATEPEADAAADMVSPA